MTDILLEAGEEDIQLDEHEKKDEEDRAVKSKASSSKNNNSSRGSDEGRRKVKGRGFDISSFQKRETAERYSGKGGQFETLGNHQNSRSCSNI